MGRCFSAGMVYFNPKTNQKISAPTPIDEKTPVEILQRDAELAKKEVVSFFQKNLSLKDEIQEDFDKYQVWEEHRKQVLAGLGR